MGDCGKSGFKNLQGAEGKRGDLTMTVFVRIIKGSNYSIVLW